MEMIAGAVKREKWFDKERVENRRLTKRERVGINGNRIAGI